MTVLYGILVFVFILAGFFILRSDRKTHKYLDTLDVQKLDWDKVKTVDDVIVVLSVTYPNIYVDANTASERMKSLLETK